MKSSPMGRVVVFLLTSLICATLGNPKEITIDAACSVTVVKRGHVNHLLYLYSDKKIFLLKEYKLSQELQRNFHHVPEDMNLQAAYTFTVPDEFQFYGDQFSFHLDIKPTVQTSQEDYDPAITIFRNGGPDAVARRVYSVYFFKGCQMVARDDQNTWGQPVDIQQTYGLPCNIDAAWKEGQSMVILKGDKIWRWGHDDLMIGPRSFKDAYNLKDWTLKP